MKTFTFTSLVPFYIDTAQLETVKRGIRATDSSLADDPQFEDVAEAMLQQLHEAGLSHEDVLTISMVATKTGKTCTFIATTDGFSFPVAKFKA